jgi:hypothetical protein
VSAFDWKKLSPHVPVKRGDDAYVERPFDGGERLAMKVRAGLGPVAVAGPVGCGKSTEVASAKELLTTDYAAMLLQLDRTENLRLTDDPDLAVTVVMEAFSKELKRPGFVDMWRRNARDALLDGLRSMKAAQGKLGVAVLFDGLEKMRPESALAVVRQLLALRDEARFVFVVPSSLVTGPETYLLSSEDVRVFPIRAVPVGVSVRKEGENFLKEIARRRLGVAQLPPELTPVFDRAALASGGLPRAFLQILQDAAGYASLEQREAPSPEDLRNALQDHAESIRRLLREGDLAALYHAHDTDGLEVPLERRLRLLSHGILLEYSGQSGRSVVRRHPLTDPELLKVLGLA